MAKKISKLNPPHQQHDVLFVPDLEASEVNTNVGFKFNVAVRKQ